MKPLLLLVIMFSLGNFIAWSQYPAHFSYTIENGAPSNEIYSIIQDSKGYVWIGCDAGIYRYNGVRFEQFQSEDLTARSATGLVETTDGRIYGYNFNNQLFYVEHDSLHVYKNWELLINGIADDKKGNLWISTQEGPFKLNRKLGTWDYMKSSFHTKDSFGSIFTHGIRSDDDGTIYYHNYTKIITWQDNRSKGYELTKKYFDQPMVIAFMKGQPWLFDIFGELVYKGSKGKWEPYNNANLMRLLKGRKITLVKETEPGIVWVCTYSGIIRFETSTGKSELLYEKFSFSDVLLDREGCIWMSTLSNGVIRIPNYNIRVWDQEHSGLNNDNFRQVKSSTEGIYLSGSSGDIVHLTKNKELRVITNIARSDINGLYFNEKEKVLYYQISSKIYGLKNDEIQFAYDNPRPLKSIIALNEGYFFLSSQGMFYTKDLQTDLDLKNRIIDDWCRQGIQLTGHHKYLIAGNKGVYEIEKKNDWKQISSFLHGKQIISLCLDPMKETVYFLGHDGTIYRRAKDEKTQIFIKLSQELKAVKIYFYKNYLYLATNKGVVRINPRDKSQFVLNSFHGMNSNNISDLSFSEDKCWAATGKGIHMIPLSEFKKRIPHGELHFRSLIVNGKKTKNTHLLRLNHDDEITVVLDGLSYSSEDKFQFAYRFKNGKDRMIKVPGTTGKISILHLPYGKVDFEILLIDYEGNICGKPQVFSFDVLPPIWFRWWFYLLIGLLLIGVTFWIFKLREKNLRISQQKELARINLENELRLSQQSALKAQMNPHFLFNVLNSIKGYIYENDKKNAVRYLSDFSSLVRMVLDQSSLTSVSLEKELEMLKIYIDLESMLLDGEFNFELNINDNVDVSSIQIPALLLQPYIENAFKHGLRHRKGKKMIHMDIEMNEDLNMIEISITDNGIGREAANKLNQETGKSHTSFATNANQKRIDLLNFEKQGIVGVVYNDNFDETGNVVGTTVIVRIYV